MTFAAWNRLRGVAPSLIAASIVIAGCSTGPSADDATVIIPEPAPATPVEVAVKPAEAVTETTPVEPAPAVETSAPEEIIKGEGWGTITGRVVFQGDAPEPAVLVQKGDKNVQGGAICSAKEILSERLVVNPEDKGVRYAIVFVPKPTAVNPEAESAAKTRTSSSTRKGASSCRTSSRR